MCMVRDIDRLLALSCKHGKDRCILSFGVCTIEGSIDYLLPKASDCMTLEIGCRTMVLQILEVPNTIYALKPFTLLCGTGKEVEFAFVFVSNLDTGFEEAINR
jgi:hypothetical protein